MIEKSSERMSVVFYIQGNRKLSFRQIGLILNCLTKRKAYYPISLKKHKTLSSFENSKFPDNT